MVDPETNNWLLTPFGGILYLSWESRKRQYKLMMNPVNEMLKFYEVKANYKKWTSLILARLCNLNLLETLDIVVDRTHMAGAGLLLQQETYSLNLSSSQNKV